MMQTPKCFFRSAITVAVGAAVALSGCATPQYMSQSVDSTAVNRAGQEIHRADNWVPRYLSDEDAEKKVLETYARLLPGATQVCRELGEDECGWDIRYSADDDFNAYATGESIVVIKKGILRHAENDDEIALVIAHEMSHHAADHLRESKQNAATGAIVGGVLLGALTAAAYGKMGYSQYSTQYQVNNAVNSGMKVGAAIGDLSFSKDQENEADYLAAHILRRGGYDLDKARIMWMKFGRLGTTEHGERHSFNTHPDPAERLARWDATAAEIGASPDAIARLVKRKPNRPDTNGYVVRGDDSGSSLRKDADSAEATRVRPDAIARTVERKPGPSATDKKVIGGNVSASSSRRDANSSDAKGYNYSGKSPSPWFGMRIEDSEGSHSNSQDILITRVDVGGPAHRAGLCVGDVIETFNGVAAHDATMVAYLAKAVGNGARVPVVVRRGNDSLSLVVTMRTRAPKL